MFDPYLFIKTLTVYFSNRFHLILLCYMSLIYIPKQSCLCRLLMFCGNFIVVHY